MNRLVGCVLLLFPVMHSSCRRATTLGCHLILYYWFTCRSQPTTRSVTNFYFRPVLSLAGKFISADITTLPTRKRYKTSISGVVQFGSCLSQSLGDISWNFATQLNTTRGSSGFLGFVTGWSNKCHIFSLTMGITTSSAYPRLSWCTITSEYRFDIPRLRRNLSFKRMTFEARMSCYSRRLRPANATGATSQNDSEEFLFFFLLSPKP